MTYKERVEELKEQLADIEHQRWADWQKWCHQVLRENITSCPQMEIVLKRWEKQIATPYKDLSEKEKQSDRDQVDRYLPLILHLIEEAEQESYKRGYIDGGVSIIAPTSKNPSPSKGLAELNKSKGE